MTFEEFWKEYRDDLRTTEGGPVAPEYVENLRQAFYTGGAAFAHAVSEHGYAATWEEIASFADIVRAAHAAALARGET